VHAVRATWSVQPDHDGTRRVVVVGELDLSDEESFVAAVDALAGEDGDILLDLDAVGFIDSSGVRAILRLHLEHADRLRLVAASDAVNKVLRIAGLTDVLGGAATVEP
jgi:anti-sigma B factor antagonist